MLIGKRAANHPQQIARRGALDDIDDRGTTHEVFGPLDERYGPFTVDVAAAAHNAKVPRYYDRHTDGLGQSWAGERVWCNPPYSSIEPWIRKAWAEHASAECIVMLLPANRTEQGWWMDLVEPYRDRAGSPLGVEFLRGRPRFVMHGRGHDRALPNSRPPFGLVVLTWSTTAPPHPDQLSLLDMEDR